MWRNLVIYIFIVKEVELPVRIEKEISKILVHVGSQDPSIKTIYDSPPIHYLQKIIET